MGYIEWTPTPGSDPETGYDGSDLGTYRVEEDEINISVIATYIPDEEDLTDNDTVISMELITAPELRDFELIELVEDVTVTMTGMFPLSIFDRYSTTYVDKGESNKTMSPVVSSLEDMPDFKEMYEVEVDERLDKTYDFTVQATTENGLVDTQTYSITAQQNWDRIRDWVKRYFEERY